MTSERKKKTTQEHPRETEKKKERKKERKKESWTESKEQTSRPSIEKCRIFPGSVSLRNALVCIRRAGMLVTRQTVSCMKVPSFFQVFKLVYLKLYWKVQLLTLPLPLSTLEVTIGSIHFPPSLFHLNQPHTLSLPQVLMKIHFLFLLIHSIDQLRLTDSAGKSRGGQTHGHSGRNFNLTSFLMYFIDFTRFVNPLNWFTCVNVCMWHWQVDSWMPTENWNLKPYLFFFFFLFIWIFFLLKKASTTLRAEDEGIATINVILVVILPTLQMILVLIMATLLRVCYVKYFKKKQSDLTWNERKTSTKCTLDRIE